MRTESTRRQMFTRRAFLLGAGKAALLTALAGRMYHLQAMRGDEYQTLSDNNRIRLSLTAPERGQILDLLGRPMATNETNFRLYLEAERGRATTVAYDVLAPILEVDAKALEAATRKRRPTNNAILIAEHLRWDQLAAIELRAPELPNLFVDTGKVRTYPFNDVTAHLLGYVGAPAVEDGDEQFFRRLPELRIGKRGVEKAFEERLRGTPGTKQQEVNAAGLIIRDISHQPSTKGEDIVLTIDRELQIFCHERLSQEKSAAAIVMDVHTGAVYALSSTPSFDPNEFSKGIGKKEWNALVNNVRSPLLNKAIAGQYPPGSTYKMLIGLAGLKEGTIHENTRYHCPGAFSLGNHVFHCWKREGHGSMNVREAIQQSCDVFFYNVAQRTGQQPIADLCRDFGLGSPTGIEIPGEQNGIVPDAAWKKRRFNQPWQAGDTINASIGQGYVLTTPLQLTVFAANIANGGYRVRPTLIAPSMPEMEKEKIPVSKAHLTMIQEGMDWVVNRPGGTAYGKRIAEPGFEFAGKTGTSQVRALSNYKLSKDDALWNTQHHGLFIGYAPVHKPRFAVGVIVEHGGSGSGAAAPVAHDLLLKVQQIFAEREGAAGQ
jgi:penicillin-binding protein 2